MKIQLNDFNFYMDHNNNYIFYYLNFDGECRTMNHVIDVNIDPIVTLKTLVVQGMRFNPHLPYGVNYPELRIDC